MKKTMLILLIFISVVIIITAVFFVFTTSMSSPTKMTLNMPRDNDGPRVSENSLSTLTLLLLRDNMIYAYFGSDVNDGKRLKITDAHNIIAEGVQKFTKDSLLIVIKPSGDAAYKNTVDILDEMAINDIKNYRMVDLSKAEQSFVSKK